MNKYKYIFISLIVVIVLLFLALVYIIVDVRKENNVKVDTQSKTEVKVGKIIESLSESFNVEDNVLYDEDNNVIKKVNTKGEFVLDAHQLSVENIVFTDGGEKRYLTSAIKDECDMIYEASEDKLYKDYCYVATIYKDNGDYNSAVLGFVVTKDNKEVFINLKGELLSSEVFDNVALSTDSEAGYIIDYNNNLDFKVSKNNKYGIYNLKDNKYIVDINKDDVKILSSDNYGIKDGSKWYLVNKNISKISDEYDNIISIYNNDKYFGVLSDNEVNIIDSLGNEIIDEDIEYYYYDDDIYADYRSVDIYYDNNKISIYISKENDHEYAVYEYSINSKKLDKIK